MSFLTTLKNLFGLSRKKVSLADGDRMLPCADCEQDFVFDAGEQRFFKEKGFTDPKRCPRCRKKVRSRMRRRGRGGRGDGGDRGDRAERPARHDRGDRGHRGGNYSRRHSVIEGTSPYADER